MSVNPVKVKILEEWYVVDSILLGGHAKDVISSPKQFEQYVALKGSLLSSLFEFYSHIKYIPKYDKVPRSVRTLTEAAKQTAIHCKKLASNIMNKDIVRESLKKKIVREGKNTSDMDKFADKIIREKFNQLALDNALMGIPIIEAANKKACEDFTGQMLQDSYKLMRNAVVRLAKSCTKK